MAGKPIQGEYGTETRTPAIPDVRTGKHDDLFAAIKEWIEVRQGTRGDGLDRAVTMRDLLNAGLASPLDLNRLNPSGISPIPLLPGDEDPAIPPTPDNLEAAGAIKYIILTWEFARGYSRLAYFEVWRSLTDNLAEAVQVGQTFAPIYADEVGGGKSYYYWVRAVSDAAASPFNSVSGTLGQTIIDPAYLVEQLVGKITASQLNASLASRIDLIDASAAVPGSVAARVYTESQARTDGDDALSDRIDVVSASSSDAAAGVVAEALARADGDDALAYDITQVTARLDNVGGVTLEQKFTAQANTLTGLSAQYTVKIDNNGYVAGYGLASTPINGVPYSSMIFRSDDFAIGSPTGPDIAPAFPFIVQTTPTTLNGVAVPIGVYMTAAFIINGAITNAKIGALAVDDAKIANLNVSKLLAGAIDVGTYIQSTNYLSGDTGWRIHGNGNSEFANTTVRGGVYATFGQIGGNTIDTNGIQSTNYTSTTGWRIDVNGTAVLNNAAIRGALFGVTGTFSGALSTSNYAQDGAGNPTAGAKMDGQGTTFKVANNAFQVGTELFSDYWFRLVQGIDGSIVSGKVIWRGNNSTTTRGGAPNIACLSVTPISSQRVQSNFQQVYHSYKLTPTAYDAYGDNLDAMSQIHVQLFQTSSSSSPFTEFYQSCPSRIYEGTGGTGAVQGSWHWGWRYAGTGAVVSSDLETNNVYSGYMRVRIANSYGFSAAQDFGPGSTINVPLTPITMTGSTPPPGGGGGGSGGGCPAPWVPVTLISGKEVPAGDLYNGAVVAAVNDMTLQPLPNGGIIRQLAVIWAQRYRLKLVDGTATEWSENHRFAVKDRGWVHVQHLLAGDHILGMKEGIVGSILATGEGQVISYQVEGAGTYFAGGLLSHNYKEIP